MIGCSIEEARGISARSALVFIGRALPGNLLNPVLYRQSRLGLGGNVRVLAERCASLTVHAGSPVSSVRRLSGGGFAVENAEGRIEDVDALVLATPPYVARGLLSGLGGYERVRRLLDRFEYFPSEIAIHRDPAYMPGDPGHWSAYNSLMDGTHCEASIWYGAFLPSAPMLFKSWATARSREPEEEIFRRDFLHPRISPDSIRAGRRLADHQGQGGVWFAGSYTREVDSQDTALLSAMTVARALAPEAPNLAALEGALS
jgi:predicted NAD/FAD-binding protein